MEDPLALKRAHIAEVRESDGMRPSEVFALRLRETRKARQLSQAELARRMTESGRPMSRAALLSIENGTRGLSLDEALGFAEVLNAVPAQLLSPPEEKYIFVTDWTGYDGSGLRSWLRFGHHLGDISKPSKARQLDYEVAVHARAFVDAERAGDKAGIVEALEAILAVARREGIPISPRRGSEK